MCGKISYNKHSPASAVAVELLWMDLTTCDVNAILEEVICQMHAKEMIHPPDDGPRIRIRCGGLIR